MRPPLSQLLTEGQRRALNEAARAEACRRGALRFLLHSSQREVLDQFEATTDRFVLEKGRRWGGTWFLLVLALMFCFRKPKTRVVYGAPTLKFLKEFVLPTLAKISLLLPVEFRPKFNASSSHIECWNGSYVHLFGCDDQRQADTGSGTDADLAIFDEAGAVGVASLLPYIITSIFEPQLMENIDREEGRIILSTSPPRIPEHAFVEMADLAEKSNHYAHRSIHDNPRMTPAMVDRLIQRKAREEAMTPEAYIKSDTWRREYLAERVIDKLLVVLPEWEEKRSILTREVPRPEFFDAHVIYDPGGADPHFALFGYWHFPLAKWVIEDEVVLTNNENIHVFAEKVKATERRLWGTDRWEGTLFAFEQKDQQLWSSVPEWMRAKWEKSAPRNPRIRWMDSNLNRQRDLFDLYGLAFCITAKNDMEAQVNLLRELIRAETIIVHPRCKALDKDWRGTTWANHRRQEFARKAGSHGDGVACGYYGARNLDRQRNPFPPGYGIGFGMRDKRQPKESEARQVASMLGLKSR